MPDESMDWSPNCYRLWKSVLESSSESTESFPISFILDREVLRGHQKEEMFWREASWTLGVVSVFVTVALSAQDVPSGSNCSTVGDVPIFSSKTDTRQAERNQKKHLEALFERYGENGSISLAGLKRLLRSVGFDRDTNVTEQHHHHHEDGEAQVPFKTAEARQKRSEGECENASSLLWSHGMTLESGVTLADFAYLCPALLNQIDSRACTFHDHHNRSQNEEQSMSSRNIATAWVGGFLSITVISLLSLVGVVLIPLMNKVFFKFLLSFLVALAVGTLSGDAFLHLIPHSQGGHQHPHSDDRMHHEHDDDHLDGVWKGLTALSGVYFMFLIEHFLTLGKMYKDKKKRTQKSKGKPEKPLPPPMDEDVKACDDVETNGGGMFPERPNEDGVAEEEQVMLKLSPMTTVAAAQGYTAEDCENKCHSHFHDTVGQADSQHHHHHDYHHILHHHHSQNHHPHSHTHSYPSHHFQHAGVATLAWMVIMGDGLHNFSDGLAIGAAFSEGLSSGLSTSVAVFCHELPHELGDFAVLLKAGMTVRQAILYNMLSATTAYLGMVTGIIIGHYAENIAMWIFALTAGLFMYVALVDMVVIGKCSDLVRPLLSRHVLLRSQRCSTMTRASTDSATAATSYCRTQESCWASASCSSLPSLSTPFASTSISEDYVAATLPFIFHFFLVLFRDSSAQL
ncbi:zinc transporter ZIP6 isoform X3 [Stigmatopora nigra]